MLNKYFNLSQFLVLSCLLLSACQEDITGQQELIDKPSDQEVPFFTEVAASAGLSFVHFIGATGHKYFVETIGTGGALFDYDNDGDLDVLLQQGHLLDDEKMLSNSEFPPPASSWPGPRLFRNELIPSGKLIFTDVTEEAGINYTEYGTGVACGDFDNDGAVDFYLTGFGDNVFYRNKGNGQFSDITERSRTNDARWSTSATFADHDRDGDLDLFIANYVTYSLGTSKPCQTAAGVTDYCGPQSYAPTPDRLLRNDGAEKFTDITHQSGISVAVGSGLGVLAADFDGDELPDYYVANDGRANQLWHNLGEGHFRNTGLMSGTAYNAHGNTEASMGVTAGDFDGDGDEDLFMTHLAGETNTLYQNDGSGNFLDVTDRLKLGRGSLSYTGFGSKWFDYDNDGRLDLFIANGAVAIVEEQVGISDYPYAQRNQLFHNHRDGYFEETTQLAGPAMQLSEVSRGAAFGDIDNDGDIDILVTNNNGPVRLLLNEVGNKNDWLTLKLVGTQSNRDALGARVGLLRAGLPTVWRRVHRDGSYLSSHDVRVHFGLGQEGKVDGILVYWPSGIKETWQDININAFLTLTEGAGKPLGMELSTKGVNQ